MATSGITALTFDTGGTILDWHSGYREAFAAAGRRHGIDRDWALLANAFRRRTMAAMLNLGEDGPPEYNFDDAHRFCLDDLLRDEGLDSFDSGDRHAIAWTAPHSLTCWPDFPAVLPVLRSQFITVSFSLLSYRIVIETARHNGLTWDAVLSCEGLGIYKLLPEAYLRVASFLQFEPAQCYMVACHPFDLDAAREVGFRTALVRRSLEWGEKPECGTPSSDDTKYDCAVDDYSDLPGMLAELV